MAAKKRRLMPDLDELQYKRRQMKSPIKGVEAAVRQLKEIDLMSTTSNVLSEDHSLLWLISLYGLRLVGIWKVNFPHCMYRVEVYMLSYILHTLH